VRARRGIAAGGWALRAAAAVGGTRGIAAGGWALFAAAAVGGTRGIAAGGWALRAAAAVGGRRGIAAAAAGAGRCAADDSGGHPTHRLRELLHRHLIQTHK